MIKNYGTITVDNVTALNAADLAELTGNLLRNEPEAMCDIMGDGVTNILDLVALKKKLSA